MKDETNRAVADKESAKTSFELQMNELCATLEKYKVTTVQLCPEVKIKYLKVGKCYHHLFFYESCFSSAQIKIVTDLLFKNR
mgnify:CR=1 FL=1